MDDLEIREILAVMAHLVRAQILYSQRLHRSYVAVYEAQKAADPEFERRYHQAAGQHQVWPENEEWLRSIDELIERLQPK